MRLHAAEGFSGKVIDLDTGQPVRKLIWIETDPPGFPPGIMLLEAWHVDQLGNIVQDAEGDPLFYQAKGRFKIVQNSSLPRINVGQGADACARCGSPLTLAGMELCPFCNAYDKGTKKFSIEPVDPLLVTGCQYPGCNNRATRQVGDEVAVSDVVSERRFYIPGFAQEQTGYLVFDRGAIVNRRWWCDWHYQPPRILDPKGEVIEVLEDKRTISA